MICFSNPTQALTSLEVLGDVPALLRSVINLCNYEKDRIGAVRCTLPRGVSLLEVFEAANVECARLGINLAVDPSDIDWWRRNSNATVKMTSSRTVVVTGLVDGSAGEPRGKQEYLARGNGGTASIEVAALANILEHVATFGRHDLFEGKWIRTEKPGIALRRDASGLYVYKTLDSGGGHVIVGCAAARWID